MQEYQPYQVQYRHLHHALVEVRGAVLDHLDGHDLLCLQVLALDDLTESTLAQHIEDKIPVPGQPPRVSVAAIETSYARCGAYL